MARWSKKERPSSGENTPKNVGESHNITGTLSQTVNKMILRCRLYPTLMDSLCLKVTPLTSSKPLGSKKKWPICRDHIAMPHPSNAAASGLKAMST